MLVKGLAAALLMVITVPAQWGTARPSPFVANASACAGYDPISGDAYLIQAATGGVPFSMWRFDDGLWTQLTQLAAQPPTSGATCSWPGHGLLVQGAGTWLWNGTVWTQIVTSTQPPGVYGMDLDPVHGVVIALTYGNETWSFDGTDWQQLTTVWPSGGPQVVLARLAWEPVTQTMIAAAGYPVASGLPNCPFYRWNGSAWTMTNTGARYGFSLTSVPGRGVFASGGFSFPLQWGITGLWDGSQWSSFGSALGDSPALRQASLSWFDEVRGRLVVTSSLNTGPTLGVSNAFGTWYSDGVTWTRPAFGRGPRFADAQAYDSWRGQLLQFGGTFAVGYEHDQLWGRDADGIWTRLAGGPAARRYHACAFDSWRGRMVMIGGSHFEPGGGSEYLVDAHTTWEWDGAAWSSTPSPSPAWSQQDFPVGRIGAAMAFDRARGRCVLFGGRFGYGDPLPDQAQNDTWEWDGATWTLATPTQLPPAVAQPTLWYDPNSATCMLWANGLWSWDGSDWTAQSTPPLPNGAVRVGFDAAREVLVAVVGNVNVTTTYQLLAGVWQQVSTTAPFFYGTFDLSRGAFATVDQVYWFDVQDALAGSIAPFGVGCAGSAGTPVLHGERPFRIGSTRSVQLANAPLGAPWFGVLGPDDDQWQGAALPLDLAPLGAPQCFAHTGVEAFVLVAASEWEIVVPPATQLLGARVRLQALVLDVAANALGATTSNGVRVRIGA